MKTNYPESKPRKIRVRSVKPSKQLPVLNIENVVDARERKRQSYGGTFFLKLTDSRAVEKQSWKKLNKRLGKRLNDR